MEICTGYPWWDIRADTRLFRKNIRPDDAFFEMIYGIHTEVW